MSKKKNKRQRQRQNFPWLLAVLGGVFLVIAALFVTNRDGGGTPSLAVDLQRIDYGDVKFDTPKTFALRVTNTGDGTLRFKEDPYIEVVEGC